MTSFFCAIKLVRGGESYRQQSSNAGNRLRARSRSLLVPERPDEAHRGICLAGQSRFRLRLSNLEPRSWRSYTHRVNWKHS